MWFHSIIVKWTIFKSFTNVANIVFVIITLSVVVCVLIGVVFNLVIDTIINFPCFVISVGLSVIVSIYNVYIISDLNDAIVLVTCIIILNTMIILSILNFQCCKYLFHCQMLSFNDTIICMFVWFCCWLHLNSFLLIFLQILYYSLPYSFIISNSSTLIKYNINIQSFSWWSYCCSCCLFL